MFDVYFYDIFGSILVWQYHTFISKRKAQTIAYASRLTTSHNTLSEKSALYTDFPNVC